MTDQSPHFSPRPEGSSPNLDEILREINFELETASLFDSPLLELDAEIESSAILPEVQALRRTLNNDETQRTERAVIRGEIRLDQTNLSQISIVGRDFKDLVVVGDAQEVRFVDCTFEADLMHGDGKVWINGERYSRSGIAGAAGFLEHIGIIDEETAKQIRTTSPNEQLGLTRPHRSLLHLYEELMVIYQVGKANAKFDRLDLEAMGRLPTTEERHMYAVELAKKRGFHPQVERYLSSNRIW